MGARAPRTGPWRLARGVPDPSLRGQATVELALLLPVVVVMILVVVQVGLVVRDQVLVVHAAREAARVAAVEPDAALARRQAVRSSGLDQGRLSVEVSGRGAPGSRVRVVTRYRSPTEVPLVGGLVGDADLSATVTMRVER